MEYNRKIPFLQSAKEKTQEEICREQNPYAVLRGNADCLFASRADRVGRFVRERLYGVSDNFIYMMP